MKIAAGVLLALHVLFFGAELFSPYEPERQDREFALAPPSRLRWVDDSGRWHLAPFVHRLELRGDRPFTYREQRSVRCHLRFFPGGARLFGVEEPGRLHLLGTDSYGRDIWSRTLHGGRLSLLCGLAGAAVSLALAALLGGAAGLRGGWPDEVIWRAAEFIQAVPWLYLLLAARAFLPLDLHGGQVLLVFAGLLAIAGWIRPGRLVRGVVLAARNFDYVAAARGFGAGEPYLLRRHLLPEAGRVLLAQAPLLVPQFVMAEVALSLFGLGVAEPEASWGSMLSATQRLEAVWLRWWMLAPAAALTLVSLGYHLLAEWLGASRPPVKIARGVEKQT